MKPRRIVSAVRVVAALGALVLGCGKAGKCEPSSQKGQVAKAAASPAPTLSLDLGGGVKMELVLIPAGEFMVGNPKAKPNRASYREGPQHRVRITKPFYIGKYEVTQAQYERVIGWNPSRFKGADLPVDTVSWNDGTEFCLQLSEQSGRTVRLPTEAEWEYACRAETTTPFHYGNSLGSDQANFNGNRPYGGAAKGPYRRKTTSVGSFQANAWGLYDMHGNVWEWCSDWYDHHNGNYALSRGQDPKGPTSGITRIIRGGSWVANGDMCRSAYRGKFSPSYRCVIFGFRVVVVAAPGR